MVNCPVVNCPVVNGPVVNCPVVKEEEEEEEKEKNRKRKRNGLWSLLVTDDEGRQQRENKIHYHEQDVASNCVVVIKYKQQVVIKSTIQMKY